MTKKIKTIFLIIIFSFYTLPSFSMERDESEGNYISNTIRKKTYEELEQENKSLREKVSEEPSTFWQTAKSVGGGLLWGLGALVTLNKALDTATDAWDLYKGETTVYKEDPFYSEALKYAGQEAPKKVLEAMNEAHSKRVLGKVLDTKKTLENGYSLYNLFNSSNK